MPVEHSFLYDEDESVFLGSVFSWLEVVVYVDEVFLLAGSEILVVAVRVLDVLLGLGQVWAV